MGNARVYENGAPSVNVEALAGLALRGPHDRLVELHRLTTATFTRLNLSAEDVQPFSDGTNNFPSLMDVKRWLDGLKAEGHEINIAVLRKFHATLQKRVQ